MINNVAIVRKHIFTNLGDGWLVRKNAEHFLVTRISTPGGLITYTFHCDEEGNTNGDSIPLLPGEQYNTHEQAITILGKM